MMGLWSFITGGGAQSVAGAAEKVGGIFKPNAEASQERIHQRDIAGLDQFAAEFVARPQRSWWDSFVDGLNRLPRPLITLGVLGMFVLAPYDPERFALIATSYSIVPAGLWALASVVIAFYFGGRMQIKSRDFTLTAAQIETAKSLVEERRAHEDPAPDHEPAPAIPVARPDPTAKNKVVRAWLQLRGAE